MEIVKGKIKVPHLILVYGPPFIGKSTFGATAPSPLFVDLEDGTHNLDVARAPEEKTKTIEGVYAVIDWLKAEKHDYQTLVIDSLDWLEPLIQKKVCTENNWKNIEDPGFGKGAVAAREEWRVFRDKLKELRSTRGLNVILTAHSQVKPFQDPTAPTPYDRHQLKLDAKAGALMTEFVDTMLFANNEVYVKADRDPKKTRAFGDGVRVMYTERRPAFEAKNRFSLPFQLPLSFHEYERAIEEKTGEKPEVLIASITDAMRELEPALQAQVKARLEKVGTDRARLIDLKNKVLTALGQAA